MAISGSFTSDGLSAEEAGFEGNVDFSLTMVAGAKATVRIQVSYDAGVTWKNMVGGGRFNTTVDMIVIAGSVSTMYRLKATGVAGSVDYFLGN